MKIWIFLPPDNTSVFANFKIEFFSSCSCKLRKMSWGEFGIFISQNYSWLGNSCSQHTWIKETDTHKKLNYQKNLFYPDFRCVCWMKCVKFECFSGWESTRGVPLPRVQQEGLDHPDKGPDEDPGWEEHSKVIIGRYLFLSLMMILRTDRKADQKQRHKKMPI